MPVPLEDTHIDILRKAMRGLGSSESALAANARLPAARIKSLLAGEIDEASLKAAAAALGLGPERLLRIARRQYVPETAPPHDGFAMFSNPHDEGVVNFFLVWDPATREAAMFDAGYDASLLLSLASSKQLAIRHLFLTHTHGDHVFDADRTVEKTGARAWFGTGESFHTGEAFVPGREFPLGHLIISTRSTRGHSRGGISYIVHGLDTPLAIVGDALFAASMGGPGVSYQDSIETNRASLFTLPDETIVCPGHGPLTTIGLEKRHNPFYPEFSAEQ